MRSMKTAVRFFLFAGAALMLGACASVDTQKDAVPQASSPAVKTEASSAGASTDAAASAEVLPPAKALEEKIYRGTGKFIDTEAATRTQAIITKGGDITLNFENASIQEVTKAILGDMLKENYVIDPGVKGAVSLQTSRPVRRDTILPILEKLLRMNGAALVVERGLYRISPLSGALGALSPQAGRQIRPGYRVQVVPLRYIGAKEMQTILEPLVGGSGILRVDERRNLLMLAGSSQELQSWLTTVDIFDVDWMQGYSVGLIPLEHVEAKAMVRELRKVLGDLSERGVEGIIRLEPMERLNAILVVTMQMDYMEKIRGWVERLDTPGAEPGARLYVFQAKNRKASELAAVLSDIFGEQRRARRPSEPARLAPGLEAVRLESTESAAKKETSAAEGKSERIPSSPASGETVLSLPEGSEVRIVADWQNNSIMVLATGAQYKIIEAALRKLDVVPLQVLIEASIVEVSLTDELSYGLEWFFKGKGLNGLAGRGRLDLDGTEGIGPKIPGFSYTIVDSADAVRAVLNALAGESKLNMISSPSLMVLDNREAKIRVGEQVPVRTGALQITGTTATIDSFQYKDTGVLLSVIPRVNVGGLVTMEIKQEVTDLGAVESTTSQRKFLQRSINSVVAVQDGQTIVLGGLILENSTVSESGLPGLYKIPVLGKLFGATEESKKRTELVVLITPRVAKNQQDSAEITEEFRSRLKKLQPPAAKGKAGASPGA
jgi:general secretion pathway protein D